MRLSLPDASSVASRWGRSKLSVNSILLTAIALCLWGCDLTGLSVSPTATAITPPQPTTVQPTRTPFVPVHEEEPTTMPTSTASVGPSTPTATELGFPTSTSTPFSRPNGTGTPVSARPTSTVRSGTPIPEESPPPAGWTEVGRVPPGKKQIALTFDAGGSGETWPRILAALREHNVHITMFITGKFAEQYPDAIKQAVADGNEIANHTYSHLDSRNLTDDQLIEELARTERIIGDMAFVTTKPYWRPPFGARNNHVLNVAVSQGYRSIYWTLDSLDSVGQPKTADFIFNRVTNTPGVNLDGAIILQHFGSEASAEALPRELDRVQEMGLRVVTISELLAP